MMFPPMGFLGSVANMEAPSTCATTWLLMTTATPNCTGMKLALTHRLYCLYTNVYIVKYITNNEGIISHSEKCVQFIVHIY